MTKKVTTRESDDATTSRGTVKGYHPKPATMLLKVGSRPHPRKVAVWPRALPPRHPPRGR